MVCKKTVHFWHGAAWHRYLVACIVVSIQSVRVCIGQMDTATRSIVYKTPVHCAGQVLRADLRQISGFRRSLVSCAASCSADSSCKVFVYDPATQVCTLGSSVSADDCTNMEAANGMVHFQKSNVPSGETACKNGGTLTGNICQCAPAYFGDHCDLGPMQDCSDYYTILNMSSAGIYVIHPVTSAISFSVHCNVQSEVRTYIMSHTNKTVNFTHCWRDYRDGFGDLNADHWLGLKYLHLLTSNRNYELRFLVRLNNDSFFFQSFSYFKMSDETNGYHIQHFNVTKRYTLGDFLTPVLGANFSTFDNDNDGDNSVNCAARFSGGWWYMGSNCTTSNPTGPLTLPASGIRIGVDNEAFWQESLGNLAPFKIFIYLVRI